MLINISELDPRGLELDTTVQVPPFDWEGDQTVEVGPVPFRGTLRVLKGLYELRGAFDTLVRLKCTRCLVPHEREVAGKFRLFLAPAAIGVDSSAELARSGSGAAVEPPTVEPEDEGGEDRYPLEGWVVDLAEILREQIDLQLPMAVRCREQCRGLCAVCGADLNEAACNCRHEADARWAALAQWRQRKDRS